ncbi:MAG: hypothetical protein KAR43_13380 [Deltaproteobacteria bacterium]|jgi:hypothetical protein|nr:hypothetical protein [Deltaproteobacteria bacterium]
MDKKIISKKLTVKGNFSSLFFPFIQERTYYHPFKIRKRVAISISK